MELSIPKPAKRFTFKKNERLCEKKSIGRLFKEGKPFFQYPFKIIYLPFNEPVNYPAKVLISVPKRHFKKAVDRNRIKRLVRESYRKHKMILWENSPSHPHFLIAFVYTATQQHDYPFIEKKIILALQQISTKEK